MYDLRENSTMPRTAVVALGGNAILRAGQAGTYAEQAANAHNMALAISALRAEGWVVVIVHGNGPQVGNLAIQQHGAEGEVPALPLFIQGAMTQGELGTLLVIALLEVLDEQPPPAVISMVTHVVVASDDPAFAHPTKPIGPFFTREEATRLAGERGWTIAEDSGRGYRQVVASPRPLRIVEIDAVRALVDQEMLVIAAGGGGVPVVADRVGYHGVDGVIDKDRTAQLVATALGADALVLVTDIDQVQLDFGTERQRAVADISVEEMQRHLDDDQFPAGSMGPKVSAAVEFVRCGGQVAVITNAERMTASLATSTPPGSTGTRIMPAPHPIGADR
jgi:carbamate kinase